MAEAARAVKPDDETISRQRLAADPAVSAFVSANAGSGKTYVLATRVIRLLLRGVDPSKLLCLTYTKTAAAEMKGRIFKRLGGWVTMDDAALRKELVSVQGREPKRDTMVLARTLFARSLEAPGGLKIQTIHAFCEALLHRFPLEANVAGHFELLDDYRAEAIIAEAKRAVLGGVARPPYLVDAIDDILTTHGEAKFDALLTNIIARRRELAMFFAGSGLANERQRLVRQALGVDEHATEASILKQAWPLPWFGEAQNVEAILAHEASQTRTTIREFARNVRSASKLHDLRDRFEALKQCFLKGKDDEYGLRTQHMFPKNLCAAIPGYQDIHGHAAQTVLDVQHALAALGEADDTMRALTVAKALIGHYETLKRVRGYLDFDDLIERTAAMLRRQGGGAWVRYKLDQGIDHILVDEAQDTSPLQWDVIQTFADEFFDGDGARVDQSVRTVFAVGDEKQSIYSFQGADPKGFARSLDYFKTRVQGAEQHFEAVPLDRSFRSATSVLKAVDLTFSVPTTRAGLSDAEIPPEHTALRDDAPGEVVIWDVEKSDRAPDDPEDWRQPVDAPRAGEVAVAERIAATVHQWIADKKVLPALNRVPTPGDVLVLVRRRGAFVNALTKALKASHVPVAGADRLVLTDHIAVLDLIALGKCLLNTRDDLSLANVLKSPLFGLTDDDLMDLRIGHTALPLWTRLGTSQNARHRDIHSELGAFRERAFSSSPFDFYAHVLSANGGREALIARLSPETPDMLDEFMAYAEAFERDNPGHLQLFLAALENEAPTIKREMETNADAVRVMTVHGAKGLEAPIVFLVDDSAAPFNRGRASVLPMLSAGETQVPIWYRGSPRSAVIDAVHERERAAHEAEYRRLLYVGMTRAADVLYVTGYVNSRDNVDEDFARWHSMVKGALTPHAESRDTHTGTELAYRVPTQLAHASVSESAHAKTDAIKPAADDDLTDRVMRLRERVPKEPRPRRPLVPSGATQFAVEATTISENECNAGAQSILPPPNDLAHQSSAPSHAQRGVAMHTLLQYLPDIAFDERVTIGRQWLAARGYRPADAEPMLDEVFGVLDNPAFAALFAPGSMAEVPVMGTIMVAGEERGVSGVIDRLAITGDIVTVLDYKTARSVPQTTAPTTAITQMALYGALLAPLYPGKSLHTLVLYTAAPKIITVTPEQRADALAALAKL